MDANDLLEILEPLVDSYQRSSRSGRHGGVSLEDRVEEIYQAVLAFAAKHNNSNEDAKLDCMAEVLVHFFDCTIAEEYNAFSKDAIDAIFELLVALGARHFCLAQEVLDRATECSEVLLDRVRASACRFLGIQASFLMTGENKLTPEERDQILDQVSQALIPRITDKVQSVRLACIQAAGSCLAQEDEDDPDLRVGLQWSLQHDPSVTNRVAALEALPVTVQTSDLILSRLCDLKSKVRLTAMARLSKMAMANLGAEQCAAIVESGSSNRCPDTKKKAVETICAKWMKEVKFDPIRILQHIGVVEHEETCEKLVKLLITVDKDHLSKLLSKADCQNYWEELESAGAGLLDRSKKRILDLTRLFYTRVRCSVLAENSENEAQKEAFLAAILPDIPTLCEQFELQAMALMKVIIDEQQTVVAQNEEEMTCVCLNLLQLFKMVDLEEGSRLHLKATMKRVLGSMATPEDLVEGCVKALRHVVGDREYEFWQAANEVTKTLDSEEAPEGVDESRVLRILCIISVVCEISSPGLSCEAEIQDDFYKMAFSATSHSDTLVREAATGAIGRLGLFASTALLPERYSKMMCELASNDDEPMEIRAQAILALSDWTLIFAQDSDTAGCLHRLVPELLQHEDVTVVCTVAEVALKLLFSGRVLESGWLACLVMLFFDPRLAVGHAEAGPSDGFGAEMVCEVGNSERLQQMLSVFFPALCFRGVDFRDAFVGCVTDVLDLYLEKEKHKRKRGGSKQVSISKILDYILATAGATANEDSPEDSPKKEDKGYDVKEASVQKQGQPSAGPSLKIALQIITFVVRKQHDCTTVFLRSLCKHAGTMDLELSSETSAQHISALTDVLGQLGTEIIDTASLKAIESLNEQVSAVDLQRFRDDDQNVVNVIKRLDISQTNSAPNRRSSGVGKGVAVKEIKGESTEKENQKENMLTCTPSTALDPHSRQLRSSCRRKQNVGFFRTNDRDIAGSS